MGFEYRCIVELGIVDMDFLQSQSAAALPALMATKTCNGLWFVRMDGRFVPSQVFLTSRYKATHEHFLGSVVFCVFFCK